MDNSKDLRILRLRALQHWYRMLPHTAPHPEEPHYRYGDVKVTLPGLFLLQALLDFPNATAPSHADWVQSALALSRGYIGSGTANTLRKASRSVKPCWVVRSRIGRRVTVQLTERGREVVNREVRVTIVGRGPYLSLWVLKAERREG